ncbi:MAG TPA: hypothetical protein VN380_01990 [Thermoanaerobaculia bacterium]|nr:hypothetical protein [Thermoanaerobaculia bacterium]
MDPQSHGSLRNLQLCFTGFRKELHAFGGVSDHHKRDPVEI